MPCQPLGALAVARNAAPGAHPIECPLKHIQFIRADLNCRVSCNLLHRDLRISLERPSGRSRYRTDVEADRVFKGAALTDASLVTSEDAFRDRLCRFTVPRQPALAEDILEHLVDLVYFVREKRHGSAGVGHRATSSVGAKARIIFQSPGALINSPAMPTVWGDVEAKQCQQSCLRNEAPMQRCRLDSIQKLQTDRTRDPRFCIVAVAAQQLGGPRPPRSSAPSMMLMSPIRCMCACCRPPRAAVGRNFP